MAEQHASEAWVKDGRLAGPVVSFATNDLTIMVPAANPAAHRRSCRSRSARSGADHAQSGVRGRRRGRSGHRWSKQAARRWRKRSTTRKVAAGMTVLTRIHHRQTPLLLMQGLGQAGVTWRSEAIFQEQPRPSHCTRRDSGGAQRPGNLQRRDGPPSRPRGGRTSLAVLHSLRRRIRRPGPIRVPALHRLISKQQFVQRPTNAPIIPPTARVVRSSRNGPMICTPIGNPPDVFPTGTQVAGKLARLAIPGHAICAP